MIPGGLTKYLQPLDVSINKPFKDELRKKYTDYWIETKNSNAKVSQNDLINGFEKYAILKVYLQIW